MATIRIAAAFVLREDGETLLVRKRGTRAFMQPGGKLEPGEDARSALLREIEEEIGLALTSDRLVPLGHFEADAANEPGSRVVADVFRIDVAMLKVTPAAEIEEIVWILPEQAEALDLAPLTRDHILPAYRASLVAAS
ncbi:8-oxo-dGTP pyrophosphatase MutT (NUDIX family) [Pararhizobium capsulatum DSM 1112]|uniref:8-oxo-dGTP pyrophosphatase MutT (NUDIX family) n=2 Tax=Pararhizobium capsulatum TaxID=34014 RepID=A0ABU0BJU1_9HYPH|nr:8-oxo-dGTP pyrophosphatase MutT (NUDIX family) [Pararhizobium capsulatum DSM 1112]